MEFSPIGTIHSPFDSLEGMPIQPSAARGVKGTVEVRPEYEEGLRDLDGFSHIILLYQLHLSDRFELLVIPYLDSVPRGVFATRAPRRPNPIGLSVVRLERIVRTTLHVADLDIVDGTPLLDIKPYVPDFDPPGRVRIGWLEERGDEAASTRSDARFA